MGVSKHAADLFTCRKSAVIARRRDIAKDSTVYSALFSKVEYFA